MPPALKEGHGIWGPPTATLDWCEGNYEVTPYIAEFWNTVTNLVMILLPLYGFYDVIKQNLEIEFVVVYGFLLLTGVGSWMFHMTLIYEMQLLDELPMVWGSAFMIYHLLQVKEPLYVKARDAKKRFNIPLALGLLSYCTLFTVLYLFKLQNPLVHEIMYALLVFAMLGVDFKLSRINYSPEGVKMCMIGVVCYATAFILWNIDNHFCPHLTQLRRKVLPSPFRPLSQLHGWWHILAGYATYIQILSSLHHRLTFTGHRPKILWSSFRGFYVQKSISKYD